MTLALILVVLISGCKKNDYQATVGVCPIVISTIPANGAVKVPLNQVVSATFNEKMNPSTITGSSFTLMASTTIAGVNTTTAVPGSVVYSGVAAFFTPSSPLTPSTTYTGRVTTAARDLTGNALQTDYVWSFATDVPPLVTSDPANSATGVLLNKVIVATFNVPMDSLTLKTPATNFTIKQGSTTVAGKFSYTSNTASFTPLSILAPFTVYTGTIAAGVKNTLGTPLAVDYIWSFTTIPQLTLSSNPLLGGTTSGAGLFLQGSTTTVVATANASFAFVNWTDGSTVVSTNSSYQLTMAGNKSLVANFVPKYVVTVLSNPVLGGISSGGGTFISGTSVTVAAVPNTGFTFTNWTEGTTIASANANYLFTVTANRNLVANFATIGGGGSGAGLIDLGTSGDFTALAMSGISTTGVTSVAGDIGVSPVAATGITGFGLIMDTNGQSSHTPIVSGKVYASDYAPPTPAKMTTAVNDMMTAYTTANGLTTGVINEIYAGNISGQTLPPGIYKWGTGLLISNAGVTLSGGANDSWVFQISQDLTVNSSAIVTLIGGAQAKNIFWVVAGQALLGPGVDFSGIILSKTLISLNTGAKVTGKLLAQTAVTLNASTVVQP